MGRSARHASSVRRPIASIPQISWTEAHFHPARQQARGGTKRGAAMRRLPDWEQTGRSEPAHALHFNFRRLILACCGIELPPAGTSILAATDNRIDRLLPIENGAHDIFVAAV